MQVSQSLKRGSSFAPMLAILLFILVIAGAAALALGGTHPDLQIFLAFAIVILGITAPWAMRASLREPSVSTGFLIFAMSMHLVGSMLRYLIIQSVYHGVSDANGYVSAGSMLAP